MPPPGRLSRIILVITFVVLEIQAQRHRAVPSTSDRFCDFGKDVAGVSVPSEFCLRKFADVPTPRVLLFAPNGDLFVASPKRITPGAAPAGAGAIFLFREGDLGTRPAQITFAAGNAFQAVHGILIANGFFYYTVAEAVYRVPYTVGATAIDPSTPAMVASFMPQAALVYYRFTHSLAAANDGSIYVSSGQMDNSICPTEDVRIGSVLRIGSGHDLRGDIVINGLRNPLYIRCMPWNSCYAAELSGDPWEAVGGTEKLIELRDGDNFGYPCCVHRGIPNPDIQPMPNCAAISVPQRTFKLHDTPFGFDWERSFGWPDPYKGAFFVGLHGSFGEWVNAGLRWAPTDPTTRLPTQDVIDFVTGVGKGQTISRVADVRFAPDGRLFFTDDQGGAIYWIAPRSLHRSGR